jgi:3-hydroxymyristoyl/3-hydroxydecanoyl-(acyl carrier protein) dehydratase
MLEFSATARVAADHPCLAGHFPGQPVVPAVLLLELVAEALRDRFGGIMICGVPSAKFLLPVLPEQLITLHLRVDTRDHRAGFRFERSGQVVARGELVYAAPSLADTLP